MDAQFFIIAGSLVLGILGLVHLIYTAVGSRLDPRDQAVKTAMQKTPLVITNQTNLWQAWLGFNYSHSLGVLWVPLIYIPLAINHMSVLSSSPWLSVSMILMAGSYAVLAKRYWFNIPCIGATIALLRFVTAAGLMHLS